MLHIFSGARTANKDTLACSVVGCCTDCGIDMRCHEIDYLNCECGYAEHNQEADPPAGERQGGGLLLRRPADVWQHPPRRGLRPAARGRARRALPVHRRWDPVRWLLHGAVPPENGWPRATAAQPLSSPRSAPDLSAHHRARLATSNSLTVRGLMLCAAVWESGGEVLIENPPDYGAYGELWAVNPRTGKDDEALRNLKFNGDHCPLWKTDWAEAFLAATKSRKFSFAQCQFGSAYQKYTVLAATLRWAQLGPSGHTPFECFHGRYCRRRGAHEKRAIGVDAHGRYVSEAAAWYPREMNLASRACRARSGEDSRREWGRAAELRRPRSARGRIARYVGVAGKEETARSCNPHTAGLDPPEGLAKPQAASRQATAASKRTASKTNASAPKGTPTLMQMGFSFSRSAWRPAPGEATGRRAHLEDGSSSSSKRCRRDEEARSQHDVDENARCENAPCGLCV